MLTRDIVCLRKVIVRLPPGMDRRCQGSRLDGSPGACTTLSPTCPLLARGDLMSDWPDVWLIVPVFNEGPVIGDVIRNARKTFDNVVCVDDGSRDNSADEIRSAGA